MSKKFVVLFFSLVMVLSLSSPAFAERADSTLQNELENELELVSGGTEGESVTSNSVDDETGLQDSEVIRPHQTSGIIYKDSGYYGSSLLVEQATATGHSNISKEFVRYLTASWAEASVYTWSKANSTSWTYGGSYTIGEKVKYALNLSTSRTTTYSIAISIPADPKRLNKLGFASDYFRQNYKYEKIVDGKVVATENSYIKTPTVNTYLLVYYK